MRKAKVIQLIALMITIAVVFAGCKANTAKEDTQKEDTQAVNAQAEDTQEDTSNLNQAKSIRIGDQGTYFTAKVAYEKGFLQEEFGDDFEITISTFSNGPESTEALNAKGIDFAFFGDVPAVVGNANNPDIKVISSFWNAEEGYYLIARNVSGIEKLEDIKGKRIAFGAGTNSHKLILKFLQAVNLKESDVEMINLSSNTAAALVKGDVDLITGSQPTLDDVLEQVDGHVVTSSKGIDSCIVVALGREEYMKANPDITARFLKVLDETNKWIAENVDEASQIVATFTNTEKEDARKYYDTRTWEIGFPEELKTILADTLDFSYKQGVITNNDVTTLYDDSYIKAAGLQK